MPPAVLVSSLVGAGAVVAWRLRETTRPVTARKIVIPPLGMSTGLCMFAYPPTHIPLSWAFAAFAVGALLLSYPLVKTSSLVLEGREVRLRRSPAFIFVLLGLIVVRLIARSYVEGRVSTLQTGSIFFLLAFGMVACWRVLMFLEYRRLLRGAGEGLGER
jgi:membrane protein CcdC involved in cytochrome C biogenesis